MHDRDSGKRKNTKSICSNAPEKDEHIFCFLLLLSAAAAAAAAASKTIHFESRKVETKFSAVIRGLRAEALKNTTENSLIIVCMT